MHESGKNEVDLSVPFKLYSNSIRLSTFEKLNLLERETVQAYKHKLKEAEQKIVVNEVQTDDIQKFQRIMSLEKNQLTASLFKTEADLELT